MIHFILLIIIFCSCGAQKSITMAHVERIEERVMPIPVGADTIEIELCRDTRLECPNEQSEKCTQNIKTCLLGRDFAQQKQDHYVKEKSSYVFLSKNTTSKASSNLWETPHSEGVNSVRISSTRGVNISRHETDTSTRIRLTLRPDTVFVPYTNHIRSDTIVVPDPTTQAKLTTARWQIAMLLLIIIVATIIFILKDKKT